MAKKVPFEENAVCDACGMTGAYDFMGDYLCDTCILNTYGDEDEPDDD